MIKYVTPNKNKTFYYRRDHQGSIVTLTNQAREIVESFTYDNHYGIITNHSKTIETNNPYGYTARVVDTPELYYYRARYYDPELQRFISQDPIGFASGDFNWYRYVGDSPVNFEDPWGYKITGRWSENGIHKYYGLKMNFSLTRPGFNSWGELTFLNTEATVYGFVVATAFCQETDDCNKIIREWKVTKRLDYSITGSEKIGINPLVYGLTKLPIPYAKALGFILGLGIVGSKIAILNYKVRRQWNSWAELAVSKLIEYGPTIFCLESQ